MLKRFGLCMVLTLALLAAACSGDGYVHPDVIDMATTEEPSENTAETEPDTEEETTEAVEETTTAEPFSFLYTLCFAGDVSLADGTYPLSALNNYGLEGCFSDLLLEHMRGADVMCLNSEFTFSTRGIQQVKNYTFRGNPSRVSVYEEMGVDLAILANNHVFDYGEVGLSDTLETFRNSSVAYVGAGENIEEASRIWYAQLDGCTVAYIAGCRVEWAAETRGATETLSGVFRTAESNALICQRIAEAKENADFVVVYVHWGQENTTTLESYQLTSGKEFIDAGADVVVGDHPHVVQGIEWYEGKPIFYSLGNYWFSSFARYSMLLEIDLAGGDEEELTATYRLIPAWTSGGKVTDLSDAAGQREFYDYMESLSAGVLIDDDGIVTQMQPDS